MPWLPFYCTPDDLSVLHGLLDDDLAFIVPDGETRWRAVQEFFPEDGSKTALWHVNSGQLPVAGARIMKPGGIPDAAPDVPVFDPWKGWTDPARGADPCVPYFGEDDSGIFWLSLRFSGKEPGSTCGVSSFGWSGDRYPYGARRVTKNRWAKLRRHMGKLAQKVPLGGYERGSPAEMWAFPNAAKNLPIADINPW